LTCLVVDFVLRGADVGGGFADGDAALAHDFHFGGGGVVFAGDQSAGVAHAFAWGGGGTGDEADGGFFDVFFDEACAFDFGGAADFADHDEGVGVFVLVEEFKHVDEVEAFDGVAADADAGGLGPAELRGLEDGFVGERAGAGDDADGFLAGLFGRVDV